MIQWRGLAQKVEHDLRVKTYDHAQRLDLEWHEKQSIGNITRFSMMTLISWKGF